MDRLTERITRRQEASPVAQVVKNLPAKCRRCRRRGFNPWVRTTCLEKDMAACSRTLAQETSWTEAPGYSSWTEAPGYSSWTEAPGYSARRRKRVRHDSAYARVTAHTLRKLESNSSLNPWRPESHPENLSETKNHRSHAPETLIQQLWTEPEGVHFKQTLGGST